MPGDDGWFDGLTINFKIGDNSITSGYTGRTGPCDITTHDFDGVLERIYDFSGIYDTTIENYLVPIDDVDDDYDADIYFYNEQPNIQITGDGYSYDLQVVNLNDNYLELFKTQMDTFTNWWDPLNDTVYWSNYEETRKYTR